MSLTVDQVAHWFSVVQEVMSSVSGVKVGLRACKVCGAVVPDTDDGHWLDLHIRYHQREKEIHV